MKNILFCEKEAMFLSTNRNGGLVFFIKVRFSFCQNILVLHQPPPPTIQPVLQYDPEVPVQVQVQIQVPVQVPQASWCCVVMRTRGTSLSPVPSRGNILSVNSEDPLKL